MVQRYKFESKSQLIPITYYGNCSCFQWFKDTNLKVNHNCLRVLQRKLSLFPMVQRYKFESKSQLDDIIDYDKYCCFQWFKDTNLKVNHNGLLLLVVIMLLFPMVQRYKFESKSQLVQRSICAKSSCFQWFKDTNLKVNHN